MPLCRLLLFSASCNGLFADALQMKSALGGGATLVVVVTVNLAGEGME